MAVDWENIAGSLVVRVNELVDTTSLKLNTLHGLLDQKEDLSNKKNGLTSTDSDHYPNVPAVRLGIDQGILTANSYTDNSIGGIVTLLGDKVDKVAGKALSDENFTAILKQKLVEMESSKFRGAYPSIADLIIEYPEGAGNTWHSNEGGWYADVGGVGQDSLRYIWDVDDFIWVESGIGGLTAEQVLQLLLANPDVNVLDDSELAKLTGIEEEAQVNVQTDFLVSDQSLDSYIKNKPTKLTDFINDLTLVDTEYVGSTSILLRAGNEFQRAALTGDVTAARNSNATTISSRAVTAGKLATSVNTDIQKGVEAESWGNFRVFGLGANSTPAYDTDALSGFYRVTTSTSGFPPGPQGVLRNRYNSNIITDLIIPISEDDNAMYRGGNKDTPFGWRTFWDDNNLTKLSDLTDDLNYSIGDITGLQSALNNKQDNITVGTSAELVTGTSTIGRIWDAKVLTEYFAPIAGYPDWSAQLLSNLNF